MYRIRQQATLGTRSLRTALFKPGTWRCGSKQLLPSVYRCQVQFSSDSIHSKTQKRKTGFFDEGSMDEAEVVSSFSSTKARSLRTDSNLRATDSRKKAAAKKLRSENPGNFDDSKKGKSKIDLKFDIASELGGLAEKYRGGWHGALSRMAEVCRKEGAAVDLMSQLYLWNALSAVPTLFFGSWLISAGHLPIIPELFVAHILVRTASNYRLLFGPQLNERLSTTLWLKYPQILPQLRFSRNLPDPLCQSVEATTQSLMKKSSAYRQVHRATFRGLKLKAKMPRYTQCAKYGLAYDMADNIRTLICVPIATAVLYFAGANEALLSIVAVDPFYLKWSMLWSAACYFARLNAPGLLRLVVLPNIEAKYQRVQPSFEWKDLREADESQTEAQSESPHKTSRGTRRSKKANTL